jgi:hypothetical protein
MSSSSSQNSSKVKSLPSVDVVITWLNDTSPRWQIAFQNYQKATNRHPPLASEGDHSPNRYRDFFILDYVVMSCCRNIPWIQSIHIIISELHEPPSWNTTLITTTCQKIPILFHTHHELITASGYHSDDILPIFNSIVIELLFPFIPSLADYFFSFNDDQILTRPLSRHEIFIQKPKMKRLDSQNTKEEENNNDNDHQDPLPVYFLGQHRAYRHGSHSHPEIAFLYTSHRLEYYIQNDTKLTFIDRQIAAERLCWSMHAPYFLKKTWMIDAINLVGIDVGLTLTHHTRKITDINLMMSLYPYYLLLYHTNDVYWISSCPSISSPTYIQHPIKYFNYFTNVRKLAQMTKEEIYELRKSQFLGIQDESNELTDEEFHQLRIQVRKNLAILQEKEEDFSVLTRQEQQRRRLRSGVGRGKR